MTVLKWDYVEVPEWTSAARGLNLRYRRYQKLRNFFVADEPSRRAPFKLWLNSRPYVERSPKPPSPRMCLLLLFPEPHAAKRIDGANFRLRQFQ
jgi:hypothetical protein